MPKQEHKILEFHGGSNNKFDPRDIAENQNEFSTLSIRRPGRLVLEGAATTLYNKTDINGHTITDIDAASGGFEKGYGLFSFSHDYTMDSTPSEEDTDYICINDMNGIDIYDPNQSTEWQANKLLLGSRTATVKPEYYNVDGALRICDSNFDVTDTSADTSAAITKNDVVLSIDNGASGNVTIATGSIIQIDQEIMYVTTGGTAQSFTVIRGYANTTTSTHADNTNVYYANVPKYFGHIKADRLFEAASSNSVNIWAEDAQTPQPPNNTRKSDGTAGTLEASAGVQSLRVYDIIEGSTTNYPAESEKVVLEFEEGQADVGIKKVANVDSTHVVFTTSGYGNNASGHHRLAEGEEITLTNMQELAVAFGGTHTITSVTSSTFTVEVSPSVANLAEDYDVIAKQTAIADWYDYSDGDSEIDNALGVNVGENELPVSAGSIYPIHITGETGVNGFNGIYEAIAIDVNDLYIINNLHGSHASGTTNGQVQQLIGIVRPSESDAIDEALKRKWNFAMSFTYDGPGQEKQESLLTMGHTVYASKRASDGTTNTLKTAISSTGTTSIDVDDSSVFTANESVIMLEDEQMLITSITDADTVVVTRGYNNTTKDSSIAEDTQIYVITELTPTATVDWTNFAGVPSCVIKSVYNHGVDEKTWNARINGFKIYMKDVTEDDSSKEFRLFSHVNFNKGTYTLFAAGDSELILEQPGTWASDGQICTISTGTDLTIRPIDTYLSENLFTEQTILDAQYKTACVVGRKVYIGNIKQGGRTYPDRMLVSPINKFDTFPEVNFIDVAVGDGDSIIKLMSFGDRLIQFKKDKVYIINVSGESEVLEAEYNNAGIEVPSQACKTNDGIAWITASGLWFFDGKSAQNLTRHIETLTLADTNIGTPILGFERKSNRLIFSRGVAISLQTVWHIYDLELKALQSYYNGPLMPYSDTGANFFTNIITDPSGDMVFGYVDAGFDAGDTVLNFYKWDNDDTGLMNESYSNFHKTKDFDFGSPATRKKIHKVYVTYKCTGHSGLKMKYATNGSGSFSDFSSSLSTNYDIDSFSGAGTGTGFKDSSGDWAVAELKPSSSINNVYSIQLSIDSALIQTGTARGGSSTTLQLKDDAATSETNDAYNDYYIYIWGGTGRFNSKKITDYNGTTETITFTTLTDKGYTNAASSTSRYILGSPSSDFEINDITIVFRPKRLK